MTPIRLGIVPYYNVLPLLVGLEETFPEEHWVRATPRELGRLLNEDMLDVAIVSVYEGLSQPDVYTLLPGVAIGSDGPVRSVSLFSKKPLHQIRSIMLDRASLTSINLAKVLATELLEIAPVYTMAPAPITPDVDWRSAEEDAFVVIGDTALEWENDFPYKLDLGEGWKTLTGLPFVFAAWWAKRSVVLSDEQILAFARSYDRGSQSTKAIVASVLEDRPSFPGGADSLTTYFQESIRYRLGPRELQGLELYRQKLLSHGILKHNQVPQLTTPH